MKIYLCCYFVWDEFYFSNKLGLDFIYLIHFKTFMSKLYIICFVFFNFLVGFGEIFFCMRRERKYNLENSKVKIKTELIGKSLSFLDQF